MSLFEFITVASLLGLRTPIFCQPSNGVLLPPLGYPTSLRDLQFLNSKQGTYFFHYDTGSNGPNSFRGERRDVTGVVSGYFGYIDPDGVLRLTHYTADSRGYRATTALRYLQTKVPPTATSDENKPNNMAGSPEN